MANNVTIISPYVWQIFILTFVVTSPITALAQSTPQTLLERRSDQVLNQTSRAEQTSQIDVGRLPAAIEVNEITNLVYVANSDSNTVSVISGDTHTKIVEDIPVGERPFALSVDAGSGTVYVANSYSDGISVIGDLLKVIARVTFHVNPINAGEIICSGETYRTEQYYHLYSGAQCIAKSKDGYEFVNWQENLEDNSIPRITDEAELNITKFGTFTANFKQIPPLVSQDNLINFVFGIIGGIIVLVVGVLIQKRRKGK